MRSLCRLLIPTALLLALIVLVPASAGAAPAGSTLLVSRPDGLGPVPGGGDGFSSPEAVSSDGRYALFSTQADGFAEGGDPQASNLMLRDTRTGTTTVVNRSDGLNGVASNKDARRPAIAVTPAGHVLVAFDSEATNLSDHVDGPFAPPADREELVWLRDVTAGTTTLMSRDTGAHGARANRFTFGPSIEMTAGGPVVAFTSAATNLPGGKPGLFIRTVDAGTTQLVSCHNRNCAGPSVGSNSTEPDLRVVPSAAGTLCAPPAHAGPCVLTAFSTDDGTISGDPSNTTQVAVAVSSAPASPGAGMGAPDVFRLVSEKNDATPANKTSRTPKINADGRAIAFLSVATNLTADAVPKDQLEAYVRRVDTGANELLSTAGDGAADKNVESIGLGGDAGHLRAVFQTLATNLGAGGPGARHDFLRDVATGTTSLVNPAGDPASGRPAISSDGSAAAFGGLSPTLDDNPGARFTRVHLRRLNVAGQPVEIVSRPNGTGGFPETFDSSFLNSNSSVSADGRYVAFVSEADLTHENGKRNEQAYVRDLATGRTTLVSRANGADGAVADADAFPAGISGDGRKVTFSTAAGNVDPDAKAGVFQAYVRDLDTNTTTLVSRADAAGSPIAAGGFAGPISANGNAMIVTTTAPLDRAADDVQSHVYVRDLRSGTMTLADRDSGAAGTVPAASSSGPVIDADGSHVAWSTRGAIAGAPGDGKDRVFVRDLRTNATTLVSRADGADGAPADDASFSPSIDGSGNVVAFSSRAPNLGAGATADQAFVRDVAGGTTKLVSRVADGTPSKIALRPAIDAAGDRVSFTAGDTTNGPYRVLVRDLRSETTDVATRADGLGGAEVTTPTRANSSLSANGGCVAFDGRFTGLNDGFDSADLETVHMRAVSGDCPAAQDGGAGGPGGAGDGPGTTTPPPKAVLSALSFKPSRFWTKGARRGTAIRYKLTQAARVTLRIDRLVKGHRKGARCVSRGHGKRCTIVKRAGTLTLKGRAGSNRQKLSGKIKGKALALGSYRVTATVPGGSAQSVRVTVVKQPRVKRR